MDASLNTQDQKEWMTGRYSLDESLILLCVIVLLSVKASQNNLAYRRKLVSIVGKWSLLPPTIGVNSHSQKKISPARPIRSETSPFGASYRPAHSERDQPMTACRRMNIQTRTDDDNNDISSSLPCAQRNQEEPLTEARYHP